MKNIQTATINGNQLINSIAAEISALAWTTSNDKMIQTATATKMFIAIQQEIIKILHTTPSTEHNLATVSAAQIVDYIKAAADTRKAQLEIMKEVFVAIQYETMDELY